LETSPRISPLGEEDEIAVRCLGIDLREVRRRVEAVFVASSAAAWTARSADADVSVPTRILLHRSSPPSCTGTVCPEATSGDGAGTFLVMGCRHALGVCGDEPRIGSPPSLVDPGVDGSIST